MQSLTEECVRREFQIVFYSDFESMTAQASEWDRFVEQTGGDIYSTFDWCRSWWEFYGRDRRLEVAIIRRNGEIVGILPFFRETQWLGCIPVRFIRMVGCDYTVTTTDVVIAPGLEKEVLSHWARQTRPDWDALIVAPLPGYQLHGLEIADAFQEVFPYSDVIYKKDYSPHIVFDLPPTFNQYLDGLSKREKANILQDDRRMRREYKVCVYARTTPENVEAAFDRFLPLHQELWQDKDRLGHFGDWPECEAFHRVLVNRLALKERLVIIELEADGRVVASQYAFTFGQRVHWFLAGRTNAAEYRKVSLGRMGLMNLVEYSIERGFNQIDGLRGYYEYKLRQGGRLTCLQSVHVIQGGLRPKLAMMLFRSGSWFLDLAYYRLWFRRISTKLGTTQPLWKTWIKSRL